MGGWGDVFVFSLPCLINFVLCFRNSALVLLLFFVVVVVVVVFLFSFSSSYFCPFS